MPRKTGKTGEAYASHYLQAHGYKIIAVNFYSCYGEIDIIAKKNNKISFVEVKTRTQNKFGIPEESFSKRKYIRMKKTIAKFFEDTAVFSPWQIDMIAIEMNSFEQVKDIRHYKNVEI